MEANRSGTRWTYTEFARLPSEGSTRHEIIGGELYVTPGPSVRHQRVLIELASRLHLFVRANDLGEVLTGPVDVLFAEGDYLEPDLVFVTKDRAALLSDRGIEGSPDLVVEIVSPSTASRDRGIKLDRYRHFGVGAYWVVDPGRRTIEVWDLAAGVGSPHVLGPADRMRWIPAGATVALEIELAELLPEG